MDVGNKIRYYRKKRGLSQDELAKKIDITPTYLSHLELNKRRITIELLAEIAQALDVSMVQILDAEYNDEEKAWIHLSDELREEGVTPEQARKWIQLAKQFKE